MFKRFILFTAVLLWLPLSAVLADELTLRKDAPERYVVKKGDTLWDLSGNYLTKPWLWPKLWRLNPQIKNPHLIYPGDVISLSFDAQGQPLLSINTRVVKLSPKKRTTLKSATAIPTLPLKLILPYLSYEQSLDNQHLESLPYVLGADDNNKNWLSGQILYVNAPLKMGTTYAIYHKGEAYTNIDSSKPLGYQTVMVGTASVIRPGNNQGEPAAIKVLTSNSEIKAGDKVLPAIEGQSLPVFFKMSKPDIPLDATIIASPQRYRQFAKYDVVVLNTGLAHQAKVGHILDIYHQSTTVLDLDERPRYYQDASRFQKLEGLIKSGSDEYGIDRVMLDMPKEKIGELMIFKVYRNISYALITTASKPARVGDTTYRSLEKIVPAVEEEPTKNLHDWFYSGTGLK